MIGGSDEDGGEVEISSGEYCSLSECIVTPDSAIGFEGSSEAIAILVPARKERRFEVLGRLRQLPWLLATEVC